MINVKKGTAHSLQQSDTRGTWITGVVSGMVCYVDTSGNIQIGAPLVSTTGVVGFAINDSVDGDAIEANKIALYTLDGQSIIETDQADSTINSTNFPIGAPVYAIGKGDANAGKVTATTTTLGITGGQILGWVEGIRNLQADGNQSFGAQNYSSVNSSGVTSTGSFTFKGQRLIPVVAIRLASSSAARSS